MSADNWTTCPKCAKIAERKEAIRAIELRESYGKIPPEEFVKAMALKPAELGDTLREDYDQGVHGDSYTVSYRCSCSICGFGWAYDYTTEIKDL